MTKVAPRRLLFILGELTHSGAEKMLEASAGLWQEAGLQPHILAVGPQPGDFAQRLADCGYVIHHIRFARSPAFLASLALFHRRHAFDIVHIHTEQAAFWHAMVARLLRPGVALFRTIHSAFAFHGLLRLRRRVQRHIMRNMLRVRFTAPSQSVADHERTVFPIPCRCLRTGLPISNIPRRHRGHRHEARSASRRRHLSSFRWETVRM